MLNKLKNKLTLKKRSTIKSKLGFAMVLESMLAIFVFMFLAQMYFSQASVEKERILIGDAAQDLSQINNGVRRLVSDFHYHLDALEAIPGFAGINTPGNTAIFPNIDFLKSSAGICTLGNIPNAPVPIPSSPGNNVDVPIDGYLACSMSNNNVWHQTYTVTFENTGSGLRAQIDLTPVVAEERDSKKLSIARAIEERAKSNTASMSVPAGNAYWDIEANPGIPILNPDPLDPNYGAIQVRVSSTGNIDQWLNLDGTSVMRGDIEMDGNEIHEASLISGLAGELEVSADTLFSGANGVYVNNGLSANKLISRGDSLLKDVYADGAISSTGDINSGGDVIARNMRITDNTIGGESISVGNGVYYTAIIDTDVVASVSVTKPVCAAPSSPRIFAVPAYPAATTGSTGYYGTYVNVEDIDATTWTIKVNERILDSATGDLEEQAVSGDLAKALVMTKCQ